jgi:hypothetical protein
MKETISWKVMEDVALAHVEAAEGSRVLEVKVTVASKNDVSVHIGCRNGLKVIRVDFRIHNENKNCTFSITTQERHAADIATASLLAETNTKPASYTTRTDAYPRPPG